MENTPKANKSKGSGALRGICILLYLVGVATSAWTQDCDTVRIYFDTDQSRIDTAMADNAAQLKHLRQTLNKIRPDTLTILSSTSPDGGEKHNSALARQRTRSLINHINKLCPTPSRHYKEKDIITRWDVIADRIRTDDSLPDKEHIVGLLSSPQATALEKQKQLKGFKHGIPYRYIARKYFPPLRYSLCILPRTLRTESYPAIGIQAVEPSVTMKPQPLDTILPAPAAGRPARWRISTNLLYWAGLAHNAGVEYDLNDRQSLTLSGACAWWSKLSRQKVYRWMAGELAFHHYFTPGRRHAGFFIGAYVQTGEFELMFGRKNRKGEFTGGGVCGGYRWIFRERLSLSAEAGIGYLYTDYQYALDLYGMLVRQGHNYSHYAGPTRLALTLAIDLKRRKR